MNRSLNSMFDVDKEDLLARVSRLKQADEQRQSYTYQQQVSVEDLQTAREMSLPTEFFDYFEFERTNR